MSPGAWKYWILTLSVFFAATDCFSQPGGGGPGGGLPPVPISGVEWLLLAGGALGVRRIYQKINKRN